MKIPKRGALVKSTTAMPFSLGVYGLPGLLGDWIGEFTILQVAIVLENSGCQKRDAFGGYPTCKILCPAGVGWVNVQYLTKVSTLSVQRQR